MRRTRSGRLLAAVALAGLAAGCAGDPMTASVHAESQGSGAEQAEIPKSQVVVRVAAATASRGDYAMAASLYRRAHALDPRNFDAAYGLARMLGQLNAPDEAAE